MDPLAPPRPDGPLRSIYVHAPFCAHRCPYCDFAVHVRASPDPSAWVEAVAGELGAVEAEGRFVPAPTLDTLYVGGGTPSHLGVGAMKRLRDVLGPGRLEGGELEWTAEANPESFTPELARSWREAGVTRVGLGVQSFHGEALRWAGRSHGPEEARAAVRLALETGFEDVNVDLLFGLPDRLGRPWMADLEEVLALDVPHVSLYGLDIEPETPLGRAVAEGREAAPDEERYREAFLQASRILTGAGYVQYELSSFALPGRASRHSLAYWGGASYLGLGNAAHSYRDPVRRWNLREWGEYSRAARRGRLPVDGREVLDGAARRLERVWLGLRTTRGLALDSLPEPARALVRRWVDRGLAVRSGGAVRLTPEGWLMTDRLAVELDARWTEAASRSEGRRAYRGERPTTPGKGRPSPSEQP